MQTIGTLVTTFTAIGALLFTGLALNSTRDQVAAAQRQNEVAQQGQYTDRYTKAVEQLDQAGPEHLQTRLGGLYALQRLAVDSPRDQPTIVNVLITFITSTVIRSVPTATAACPERIAPDTQAALTVLTKRDRHHDGETRPDSGMSLKDACLGASELATAQLGSAQLGGAQLGGANLSVADLTRANLFAATLNQATLKEAHLNEANLTGAELILADLTRADLTRANLFGAKLRQANLNEANLTGANLVMVNLSVAKLNEANLTWADLTGTKLNGADLTGANLHRANLSAVDLTGADLTGANLTGADLSLTQHDGAVVDKAITDSTTKGKWW